MRRNGLIGASLQFFNIFAISRVQRRIGLAPRRISASGHCWAKMAGNTFGRVFRLTTFGESHGPAIGGIIDGCPAGLPICEAEIQKELDLRKPGAGAASTKRKESDAIQILSGVFEGVSEGTPIGFMIVNEDQRSRDYGDLVDIFRPGHADWTYFRKFGGVRDHRGGGRASGRETACRVAGGAIAGALLKRECGAEVMAACVNLGGIAVPEDEVDMAGALARPYFAASGAVPPLWDDLVAKARLDGDSLGGIVRVVARNVPPGLGEPVFDKLDAVLAGAMLSVGAVKGVEFGAGFRAAAMRGSEHNDPLLPGAPAAPGWAPRPAFGSNNAGGILGGISTGQDIVINAVIKPIASISRLQDAINRFGEAARVKVGGRHDLSAIPRAVPVLAAMARLALADALLLQKRQGL